MVLKIIEILYRDILPIFMPLLIYYLSHNKMLKLQIVPKEYLFDLNVTIYSALMLGVGKIINCIVKQYKKTFSQISVIGSEKCERFINRYLELDFDNDVAKVFMKISINGMPSKLKKKEISIFYPPQVHVQLTQSSKKYCRLEEDGRTIKINIEKLFNINRKHNISGDSIFFDMYICKIDEIVDSSLEISITKGWKKTHLEKNEIYLKS